jgi:hypothetical protein
MSVENRFPTAYLSSEKMVHNVQFRVINITEYGYHANRLPIYDLDTLYYASNTKQVSGHSMAMGNLNKSKETKTIIHKNQNPPF